MESLFFTPFEWAIGFAAAASVGLWVQLSVNRLPLVLRDEISRRVEQSIVIELETDLARLQ